MLKPVPPSFQFTLAQLTRLNHQLARVSAGHEEDEVMEAAEAVLGHNIVEAVTNNPFSSSSAISNLASDSDSPLPSPVSVNKSLY